MSGGDVSWASGRKSKSLGESSARCTWARLENGVVREWAWASGVEAVSYALLASFR